MMPFYGDKNKTKILGKVNRKTFYWKIDTGSAVTCMNINSFETAFGKKIEGQEKYKIDIFIKRGSVHTQCKLRTNPVKHSGHRFSTKIPTSL
jgi:hypothetical protein